MGRTIAVLLIAALALTSLPAVEAASPYAGTWTLTFVVTKVSADASTRCYDDTAVNREQVWGDFVIDSAGLFTITTGVGGSVTDAGVVSFRSGPEWTGCPITASGECATECAGSMTLRGDTATWKFVRKSGSSPATGSSAASAFAGSWYFYHTILKGSGGCHIESRAEEFIGEFQVDSTGRFTMPTTFGATGGAGSIDASTGTVSYTLSHPCGSGTASGECTTSECKGSWSQSGSTQSSESGNFRFTRKGAAPTTTQAAGTNNPPYAKVTTSFEGRSPCLNEKVSFYDVSYDPDRESSDSVAAREWSVDGQLVGAAASTVTWSFGREGIVAVILTVKDNRGASATVKMEYRVIACANGTPAPTATAAEPTRAYTSDVCQGIQDRWNSELSTAKYDYYGYYDKSGREAGSDASFEASHRSRVQEIDNRYGAEWTKNNCGGQTDSSECQSRWDAATQELQSFRDKYAAIWAQYHSDLETARKEFGATGYRTAEEWREFEAAWAARSDALWSQMKADADPLAQRYRLYECGFYLEQYGAPPRAVYGDRAAPASNDAYATYHRTCEEKIAGAKAEFETLSKPYYERLRTTAAGSADYEDAKRNLARLEAEVRSTIEAALRECHTANEQTYTEPSSHRDGVGSLTCYKDPQGEVVCSGKYIKFKGNRQTQVLSEYSCGGQFWFDRVYASDYFQAFTFDEDAAGAALKITSERLRLVFHDSARGVVNVGTAGGAMLAIVPAPYILVTASADGNKVVFESAGQRGAWLAGDNSLKWDETKRVLSVNGAATWVAETCLPDGSKTDGSASDTYNQAIFERRLGASVTIAFEETVKQQDEKYHDGMEVRVQRASDKKYEATVDSADGACKTVVLKFDASIFATRDLKIGLSDENGNVIAIAEADSLEDVLNPCDDGENGFEYWTVEDKRGTHVIVSFAHFSEKRVSVEAASVGHVIVPGFGAEVLVLAIAAAVGTGAAWRRRLTR